MLFGRQPLYRLELPPRESEVRGQRSEVSGQRSAVRERRAGIEPATSALARRRSRPLNYRRVVVLSSLVSLVSLDSRLFSRLSALRWARLESNQHLRFFRPPLDLRAADPARLRAAAPHCARAADAPPVGLAPTTSCLTSKRCCCLSYGGVRCVSIVKEHFTTNSAEGGGFEPPRALRPRALATRCIDRSANPPFFRTSCRCVGVRVCRCGIPPLRYSVTPLLRPVAQPAEGVGLEPT